MQLLQTQMFLIKKNIKIKFSIAAEFGSILCWMLGTILPVLDLVDILVDFLLTYLFQGQRDEMGLAWGSWQEMSVGLMRGCSSRGSSKRWPNLSSQVAISVSISKFIPTLCRNHWKISVSVPIYFDQMSQFVSTTYPNLFLLHVSLYLDWVSQFISTACPNLFGPHVPIYFCCKSQFISTANPNLFRLHVPIYFDCMSQFVSTVCHNIFRLHVSIIKLQGQIYFDCMFRFIS